MQTQAILKELSQEQTLSELVIALQRRIDAQDAKIAAQDATIANQSATIAVLESRFNEVQFSLASRGQISHKCGATKEVKEAIEARQQEKSDSRYSEMLRKYGH